MADNEGTEMRVSIPARRGYREESEREYRSVRTMWKTSKRAINRKQGKSLQVIKTFVHYHQ